jgi:hypothetical protein
MIIFTKVYMKLLRLNKKTGLMGALLLGIFSLMILSSYLVTHKACGCSSDLNGVYKQQYKKRSYR